MDGLDVGLAEGGLLTAGTIVTGIAKYIHYRMKEQMSAQSKVLDEMKTKYDEKITDFKKQMDDKDEAQDSLAKEHKQAMEKVVEDNKKMLNKRIDNVKDEHRKYVEKTDETLKEMNGNIIKILTILDK